MVALFVICASPRFCFRGQGELVCLNKKLQRLIEPSGRLYLFVLVAFAAAALLLGQYVLAAAEGAVVRRYFAMLKQFWSVTAEIRTLVVDALGGRTRYQLVVPDEAAAGLLA